MHLLAPITKDLPLPHGEWAHWILGTCAQLTPGWLGANVNANAFSSYIEGCGLRSAPLQFFLHRASSRLRTCFVLTILSSCPFPSPLNRARLTKPVYLRPLARSRRTSRASRCRRQCYRTDIWSHCGTEKHLRSLLRRLAVLLLRSEHHRDHFSGSSAHDSPFQAAWRCNRAWSGPGTTRHRGLQRKFSCCPRRRRAESRRLP